MYLVVVPNSLYDPIYYRLKDFEEGAIRGTFYETEMQKVGSRIAHKYLIDKLLQERKNSDGTEDILVKWVGYPEKSNSWIPKEKMLCLHHAYLLSKCFNYCFLFFLKCFKN